MKALSCLIISAFLASVSCGDAGTTQNENVVQPPLPFSEVAGNLPLTSGPLADYLIFADDVPSDQVSTLRQDLKVIDSWDGTMSASESQRLKELLNITATAPSDLGIWFKSRMKYILQNDLTQYQLGLVFASQNQIGLQTLGTDDNADDASTGGGNIGTAIYETTLTEKKNRNSLSYIIVHINDKWVPVLSPEVGLMRIGPALFDPDFQVNHNNIRALSNSLQRLEVLFHEARHSDGNEAAGSLGFSHVNCPDDGVIPSELIGVPACDDTSNGAYSVGAAVLKPLIRLCEVRCTVTEQQVLKSIYIDRISRVTASGPNLKLLDPKPETGFNSVNISDFQAFALR